MNARMDNPAMSVPGACEALQALGKAGAQGGLPQKTILLVLLRASQINGCSVCAHLHARDAKKAGETDERLSTVASWHDAPYFRYAERAALALTEAATRLSDRADPVPDDISHAHARRRRQHGTTYGQRCRERRRWEEEQTRRRCADREHQDVTNQ